MLGGLTVAVSVTRLLLNLVSSRLFVEIPWYFTEGADRLVVDNAKGLDVNP